MLTTTTPTTEAIVAYLEQEPAATPYLLQMDDGYPAVEVLAAFRADIAQPPRKWVLGCGHVLRLQPGTPEYVAASAGDVLHCRKDNNAQHGQWADTKGTTLMNGKPAPTRKAASKATTTRKPAAKKASKPAASKARKAASTLPNKVRAIREQQEYTPQTLAAKLGTGWTASTVRRIERGARQATLGQVAELAAVLGVQADALGIVDPKPAASKALPQVAMEPQNKRASKAAAKPARKPAARKPAAGKVVGKRTGKVLDSKAAVKEELLAIVNA